jgi:sulfotransferase famil protein
MSTHMELTRSGAAARAEATCTLFFHIPKAAGNTIKDLLARLYPAEQVYRIDGERIRASNQALETWPVERRAQLRVVMGHMAFGIHHRLPQPSRYFTILREPVSRLVSHYYFVRSHHGHYLHRFVMANRISLLEYVTRGLATELDNGQVRMLAGLEDEPARLFRSPEPPPGSVGWGRCTRSHLEQAKHNLATYFDVVGLHSRFEATVALLNHQYGWGIASYESKNVTQNRPDLEDIPANVRDAIREVNALDVELYEFASGLFEAQWSRVPAELKRPIAAR